MASAQRTVKRSDYEAEVHNEPTVEVREPEKVLEFHDGAWNVTFLTAVTFPAPMEIHSGEVLYLRICIKAC